LKIINPSMNMKKLAAVSFLGVLTFASLLTAQDPAFPDQVFQTHLLTLGGEPSDPPPSTNFVRFDLAFLGGQPDKLIQSIQSATKKPLNVIIPEEHANIMLPELKLKGVTVPQLFDALGQASHKTIHTRTGPNFGGNTQYQVSTTSYGFRTKGQATPDSIWYFFVDAPLEPPVSVPKPPPPVQKVCRFYSLAPYLDDLKVEDITTAIETGWKMLGEASTPELKFHKDTQLLIAVGPADKLMLIEDMLARLRIPSNRANSGLAPMPRPAPVLPAPPVRQPAETYLESQKPQPPKQ